MWPHSSRTQSIAPSMQILQMSSSGKFSSSESDGCIVGGIDDAVVVVGGVGGNGGGGGSRGLSSTEHYEGMIFKAGS